MRFNIGLGHRQLLVDQAFQDLAAGGIGLLGLEALLALEHLVDLVDGDLGVIDTRGRLAGLAFGLALVAAARGKRGGHDDGQQGHQADRA